MCSSCKCSCPAGKSSASCDRSFLTFRMKHIHTNANIALKFQSQAWNARMKPLLGHALWQSLTASLHIIASSPHRAIILFSTTLKPLWGKSRLHNEDFSIEPYLIYFRSQKVQNEVDRALQRDKGWFLCNAIIDHLRECDSIPVWPQSSFVTADKSFKSEFSEILVFLLFGWPQWFP